MTDARQPWQRGVAILTAIYITRMLGLFMIFPVFSLYANELAGANKTLVGIALGIYGLSQGLLQIPCGWLSDRYGRKPVIAGGLALFTAACRAWGRLPPSRSPTPPTSPRRTNSAKP